MDHKEPATNVTEWDKQETTVTLTNKQWSRLRTYISMTTNYRKTEGEAWDSLIQEKNPDGTPRFKNAADNAQFWQETEIYLEQILEAIEQW